MDSDTYKPLTRASIRTKTHNISMKLLHISNTDLTNENIQEIARLLDIERDKLITLVSNLRYDIFKNKIE